ncbi:MAG: radical SAM protein [Candidatus Pacebacteria bacterium]|nr:radical SAM protein [Candidatus Paceibacterota bacterium]
MNLFFKKLRLRWAMSTKTLGYSDEMTNRVYSIYLNHNKIIHFRDGYPVYSLSTPALFSKPSANFFARLAFRVIQNRPTPNLMSFAVNDVCNANCAHCSFFTSVDDKTKKVLTTSECKKVIFETQELGVSIINFVGGEPLMRPDICEIIKSVDKNMSVTTLFTNGWLLTERADELKKAGLDSIYISIDSADSEIHDKKRGVKGIFNKAIEGIKYAKKKGFSVGLSCCIDREDYKKGELDKIIELAKKLELHEVVVFDALPVGRYKNREDLKQHKEWVDDMIEYVKKYNKDESYPGILVYAYTTSHRAVGCTGGMSYFYVTPYGDICPCDFYHTKFGSVREEPLYRIWDRMSTSSEFSKTKWGGCRVKESNVVECDSDVCNNCISK